MPLYTLIALLLSMFGAVIALLSSLRAHHSKNIDRVETELPVKSQKLKSRHPEHCVTRERIEMSIRRIRFWHIVWGKSLIIPVWVFSLIVLILSVVMLLFCDWTTVPVVTPTGATLPAVNQIAGTNGVMSKLLVGSLLGANILCYFSAWVAQSRIRGAFDLLETLEASGEDSDSMKMTKIA